ncbi:GNAT family N-acetyltransferase [Krasilnikoviella flava]|uniref:ElaA protein n=1 Tax=Krasilnikoviella flava TaxID=526729 RepID=A0A1T5JFU9_9MICO|nr:GNAT family N-acetyltransferase [Krasilnikoviella flava]SKC50038.1 ElaA protein [Krasilnikoviella flava]
MTTHDAAGRRHDERWQVRVATLDELDARTAYEAWRLRQDVFVVEQECAYPDLDGRDGEPTARHVVLLDADQGGRVVATARVLDDGDVQRIGRVVCHSDVRGTGASGVLMRAALEAATGSAPRADVVLGAQSPLTGWYGRFGFVPDGPEYLEDDIPHTPMRLRR